MAEPGLIEIPEGEDPPAPSFNPLVWTLTVDGLVRSKKSLRYGEILFLKNETRIDDYGMFGWDPPDVLWEGFPVRYLLSLTQPTEEARFVVFHSDRAMRTMSIAEALEYNPLLAFKLNDEVLSPARGGPLRLVYDDGKDHYGMKWVMRVELVNERPKEQDRTP